MNEMKQNKKQKINSNQTKKEINKNKYNRCNKIK